MIAVFPKEHLVVAMNSAWKDADPDANWEAEYALVKAIQAASRAVPAP